MSRYALLAWLPHKVQATAGRNPAPDNGNPDTPAGPGKDVKFSVAGDISDYNDGTSDVPVRADEFQPNDVKPARVLAVYATEAPPQESAALVQWMANYSARGAVPVGDDLQPGSTMTITVESMPANETEGGFALIGEYPDAAA